MSRAYRAVRPRANTVYSVEDVMRLYDVCRNTLSNWVSSGLRPIDTRQPQLFRGADLLQFQADRRARTSLQLRSGEFKCLGCKAAVFPMLQTLRLESFPRGGTCGVGRCSDCNVPVRKILSKTECNNLQNCLNTNTSLYPRDEDKADTPADIGKVEGLVSAWQSANDRTIYVWQIYAGCFDTKTVDAYLTSVRDFESFLEGKLFENVTRTTGAAPCVTARANHRMWEDKVVRPCSTASPICVASLRGYLPPGRRSVITRVWLVHRCRFRVGHARRVRCRQIAQAPGALPLEFCSQGRNAA